MSLAGCQPAHQGLCSEELSGVLQYLHLLGAAVRPKDRRAVAAIDRNSVLALFHIQGTCALQGRLARFRVTRVNGGPLCCPPTHPLGGEAAFFTLTPHLPETFARLMNQTLPISAVLCLNSFQLLAFPETRNERVTLRTAVEAIIAHYVTHGFLLGDC